MSGLVCPVCGSTEISTEAHMNKFNDSYTGHTYCIACKCSVFLEFDDVSDACRDYEQDWVAERTEDAFLEMCSHKKGWQPIETAPSNGMLLIMSTQGLCVVGTWNQYHSEWKDHAGLAIRTATHWMPLPSPPKGGDV